MEAKLKFWGVRGSLSGTQSNWGSHTSCVEVEISKEHSLFFDAGTGIHAASQNRKFKKISLCISHFHWDHIQGLPFLEGIYDDRFELEIISGFKDTQERLELLFDGRFHPVPADFLKDRVKLKVLAPGEIMMVGELQLSLAPLNHPGTSYAFRLQGEMGHFVYATDSDYDPVTLEAEKILKQSEFVVMDSQFLAGDAIKKSHYGHSSFKHSIDVAARLACRNVLLYHFDPSYSDEKLKAMEQQSIDYTKSVYGAHGPQVQMAREGLEISLGL